MAVAIAEPDTDRRHRLAGATVLLTGATSGIGRATAGLLAAEVGTLLVHGPEPAAAVAPLLDELRRDGATVRYLQADFASLADVERLAAEVLGTVDHLDVVINNAALAGAGQRQVSGDGNELTLQVCFLAPVLLTTRLLDALPRATRIVNVASAAHLAGTLDLDDLQLRRRYSPIEAYARAKLALVAYSCWLAERGPEVVSVHPGVVATDLLHAMFAIAGGPPERAAEAVVAAAGGGGDSGTYYNDVWPASPHPAARDGALQARLVRMAAARLTAAAPSDPLDALLGGPV